MAAGRLIIEGWMPALDASANPYPGAKITFYENGTTDLTTVYADYDLTTPLTNPVIANSAGQFPSVFADASLLFSVKVETTDGALLVARDDVRAIGVGDGGSGVFGPLLSAFGGDPEGAIDSAEFLAAADDEGQTVQVINGSFRIGSDLTVESPVNIPRGGKLVIPDGVTLTLAGGVTAGLYQIFETEGTGKVVFDRTKQLVGYPEWWGGFPGGAVDCLAAIHACKVAAKVTQLQAGDYWTSARIRWDVPFRILQGAGGNYYASSVGDVTRIVCTSATDHLFHMGPDTQPATINDFMKGLEVRDIVFATSAIPTIASLRAGVLVRYTLSHLIENCQSMEGIFGFQYVGTVAGVTRKCRAFRQFAGTGPGTDRFYGFYCDGSASIGTPGGNASNLLEDCTTSTGFATPIAQSHGFYLDGDFTDTFIRRPETNNTANGITIIGNGDNTTLNGGNWNLQIEWPTIDSFTYAGLFIKDTNKFGSITLIGGYSAPSAVPALSCVYFQDSYAAVVLMGMQHTLTPSQTPTGLSILNSSNIKSIGNVYLECGSYPVALNGATDILIEDTIKNHSIPGAGPAVYIQDGCARLKLACSIVGKANAFTNGYGATSVDQSEFCTTLINPACIAGGVANLIYVGAASITRAGPFGTNIARGVGLTQEGVWIDYTPAPTAESGTATGLSLPFGARYTRTGNMVTVSGAVAQTAIGSASGAILFPMPVPVKAGRFTTGTGYNFNTAVSVVAVVSDSGQARLSVAGAYPFGSGAESLAFSVTYEAA